MKNNYPIKYTVIPMIEQVGWSHGMNELEREYGTVYYIVSKCYLIGENKKYSIDGTVITEYQVVCPFSKGEFNTWHKDEPSFNLIHGNCTNSIKTDTLFDSFDEAKVVKKQKNEDLLVQKFVYMPIETYKTKHQEIEDEFNKTADYYDKLESEIENRTQDLIAKNLSKEQRVIHLKDNKCKKINSSLYGIIDVFDSCSYIVYSVTNEEFVKLQELPSDDEYNYNPLLINNGELKIARVVSLTGEEMYLVNNELVEKTDAEFVTPSNYDEIFYTVEDYEDIIKSYGIKHDNSKVIKLIRK